jgi:beta-glucanase (GH16 family)
MPCLTHKPAILVLPTKKMRTGAVVSGLLLGYLSLTSAVQQWVMIWNDEFSGSFLNTSNWAIQTDPCYSYYDSEVYVASAVSISNGNLVLTASNQATTINCPDGTKTKQVQSGRVSTQGHWSWNHGKFEARAKLPKGEYMWPGIWLLCENDNCPADNYLEIDTMEAYNHYSSVAGANNFAESTFWYEIPDSTLGTTKGDYSVQFPDATTPDLTADYHTYTAIWTTGYIEFQFDGVMVGNYSWTPNSNVSHVDVMKVNFLLNVALGGGAYNNPSDATVLKDVGSWTSMYVDYVRVFQLQDVAQTNADNTTTATTAPTKKSAQGFSKVTFWALMTLALMLFLI